MLIYRCVKVPPKKPFKFPRYLPFIFMATGILLLFWVSWPILSFKMLTQDLFSFTVSPLAQNRITENYSGIPSVLAASEQRQTGQVLDYSNPNNWFPDMPQKKSSSKVTSYTISIPKLKISDALVIVAGDSLDKSLVHYGGTPLPGEYGNTVIFGHSTLPQLFDQKNYKTIFSFLPTLNAAKDNQKGDEIFVTSDGVTYRYIVYDMVVTKPTDISDLEQRFDDSYLTLVTCVPPGTYWERLYVKARLMSLK
jgi:sortase A